MNGIIKNNRFDFLRNAKRAIIIGLCSAACTTLYSCKKFLDIDPPKDKIAPIQIFENDDVATSAITGIYSRMNSTGGDVFSGTISSISILCGLSADELVSYNSVRNAFYRNELSTANFTFNGLWTNPYQFIYSANSIIEGLTNNNNVSENVRKQLLGEAKFIRAFCYFYLVNLYGDVPLDLTTDYRVNRQAVKSGRDKIYLQIVADLVDAEKLLSDTYVTLERVRPNKGAAKALLSRVYLFTEQWQLAEQKATEVISLNNTYVLQSNLDNVFLKNSSEAIWQLMPSTGRNTNDAVAFILSNTPTNVSLPSNFINEFEPGDIRRTKWIKTLTNSTGTYYYPYKYKVNTGTTISEYSMVIRLAEVYLIRAEARVKLGQVLSALSDINTLRMRSGLTVSLVNLTQEQCLNEVIKQRRLELFTEWGHRWFDLKRTGRASAILSALKGSTWNDSDLLYPIPNSEMSSNPNIIQNPGY